ncbi:hypothetical protein AADEFJLK_00288 [Methylovulum psychrotolerans]|uniref:DUF4148 domain-containing protein n=2 Tax=Methylovulum psychrotolerans TaxID=1704499 RepID=A0A2S5CR19_9GAMM|nr:hypothetical protein AADEFJLK_00288 [Methylovulum psychrotolerans]
MKKIVIIGFIMMCASGPVMAYDAVDEMAYREMANINAQEQASVMHEVREGDFRAAQQIIQYDEAMKNEIRREEAMYDRARDMNQYNSGYYGSPGYSGYSNSSGYSGSPGYYGQY